MSFQDFNDEGPGTFEWDFVLGGNTTGMFPDETHYVLEGDQLTEVTFTHKGGGTMEPSLYTVYAAAMHADGYKFFRSVNGVWLTKRVPKEYLSVSKEG